MKSYKDGAAAKAALVQKGEAEWILPINGKSPANVFATKKLIDQMGDRVFEQLVDSAEAPGVESMVLTPDAHQGYGCPVGSTMITRDMVYCGPVGPDISCSMSFISTNLHKDQFKEKALRRSVIEAITERIPTGSTNRLAAKGRGNLNLDLLAQIALEGSSVAVLQQLGIPVEWRNFCENKDAIPVQSKENLEARWNRLLEIDHKPGFLISKIRQVGSYGGGNHFCESEIIQVKDNFIADKFGLANDHIGFLNHCGSRGFGYRLADRHFRLLQEKFLKWHIPFPGNDKELVYAPVESKEGQDYLCDMTFGSNVATVNHLLLCQLISEACEEVIGSSFKSNLVYHIAHNIGRKELIKEGKNGNWETGFVWRKGATRAFPTSHPTVKESRFAGVGHPILLPGDPASGSKIMVARDGAAKSSYSVNHGSGRAMGRKEAFRNLVQEEVNRSFEQNDILFNCRNYPVDESPAAYKDFNEVCSAVEQAGLAETVADLKAVFVIKDNDKDIEGSA